MNALRWDGSPGHYEVYYLTLTDPRTATGLWIRSTLLAPEHGEATAALWFVAMDATGLRVAHKETLPISAPVGEEALRRGSIADCAWDLRWRVAAPPVQPVHPLLERTGIARTVLALPHPHVLVDGTVRIGDRELALDRVPGGQAHLWGRKHAPRWAWTHCNDFDGHPGDWIDAVGVARGTPVVARLQGEPFTITSPLRVPRPTSRFGPDGWLLEARDGARRIALAVSPPPATLVGVTYHDPDGEPAYCYNSEVATMRVDVQHRAGRRWIDAATLQSDGRAHFEYAQRTPLADLDVLID